MQEFDLEWNEYEKDSEYFAESVQKWSEQIIGKANSNGGVFDFDVSYHSVKIQGGDDILQETFEDAGIYLSVESPYLMGELKNPCFLFNGSVALTPHDEEDAWFVTIDMRGGSSPVFTERVLNSDTDASDFIVKTLVEYYYDHSDCDEEDIVNAQ